MLHGETSEVTHRFVTPVHQVLVREHDIFNEGTLLRKAVLKGFHVRGVVAETCLVAAGGTIICVQEQAQRRTS